MDFSVFLQDQDHLSEQPRHRATRSLVKLVLAVRLANSIGQNAIKLTSDASWKQVKDAARAGCYAPPRRFTYIPKTMPPANGDGNIFQEPQDDAWVTAHRSAIRSVQTRAWMTYRALFQVSARSHRAHLAVPMRRTQLSAAELLAE